MTTTLDRRRAVPVVVLALVALLAGLLTMALPHHDADAAVATHGSSHGQTVRPANAAQVAFHDDMRKLWEDHVTWTRLAIVTFAADARSGATGKAASFPASAERLLANQVDIGDAIKPFYGEEAGNTLTALLHDHITIAVEIMQAVVNKDDEAFAHAKARWYANSDDIADFLAAANPKSWPQESMRAAMTTHLDQTLTEAANELGGQFAASVADYDAIHAHILDMADVLSSGIIQAFPEQFR
ncbi:MAG TPA: hypothetical protein VLC50_04420 [Actinomycetes bacterium]|nr:hypothetical protein [Actinomycetes bacterium]